MGLKEIFSKKLNRSSEKEPFQLTRLQGVILATGIEFHAEGIPWWWGIDMVNTLAERKEVSTFNRAQAYVGLATLQKNALIQARWAMHEKYNRPSRQFRVTDEGRRERSKVDVRKESKDSSQVHSPIPEVS